MKKFRVPMYCKKCKSLLGYKAYSAGEKREEPERYCGGCAPSNPPGAIAPPPFDKGGKKETAVQAQKPPKPVGLVGVKDLWKTAKAKGVKGYTKMSKDELLAALQALEEIDG